MKKIFAVLLALFCSTMMFAQPYDFKSLADMPGSCVIYNFEDGRRLNLVNAMDCYYVRYIEGDDVQNGVTAELHIKKDFISTFTVGEMVEGTEEDFQSKVLPALKEIFSYSDYGYRDQMPAGVMCTKADLNGNRLSYAKLDFYIPITYVVWAKDANDKYIFYAERFGICGANEVSDFLFASRVPEGVDRQMNKVKVGKKSKTKYGNLELMLPKNFKYDKNDYYALADTTKCDSALQVDTISFAELEVADFYAYLDIVMYSAQGIILTDTVDLFKIGDIPCFRFDYLDYTYLEKNTLIIAFYTIDGNTYSELRINGYTQFIDKNYDMYKDLIQTAKLCK